MEDVPRHGTLFASTPTEGVRTEHPNQLGYRIGDSVAHMIEIVPWGVGPKIERLLLCWWLQMFGRISRTDLGNDEDVNYHELPKDCLERLFLRGGA